MKRFILIIIFMVLCIPSGLSEEWNDFGDLDRIWDGQETITNQQYGDALETLDKDQEKKDKKQRFKLIKKVSGGGTSLHNELSPDLEIDSFLPLEDKDNGELLNLPVNLIIDGIVLDKGFYKVLAEKDNNNDIYFLFYQSQFYKGKVRASETKNDYEQKDLNFVKMLPYNKNFVKIIYGSLQYNAYAYVRFVED